MKKIQLLFFTLLALYLSMTDTVFWSSKVPEIYCGGLPGCGSSNSEQKISDFIADMLQYVAVAAVIALMLSGFYYLFSGWEEEKVNKAKKWIIWSLVGVFVSITAWSMIQLLNNISI